MIKSSKSLLAVLFSTVLMLSGAFTASAQKYNKYEDSYNFRKAMEAMDEGDSKKAEEAFKKELEEHPQNAYANLYLAHIQLHNEEYGNALSAIEQAIKYVPKKDKEYRALCYYKRAGIYDALGKQEEALADYTTSISIDPENLSAYKERADIYYVQEKYDLADADYKLILKKDASNPSALMGLGRNEVRRNNYEGAVSLFDNVIALYSDYSRAYAFRAEAYMGQKKYMEAASDVVKALELDGDSKAFGVMIDMADSAFVQISTKLKAMAVTDPNNAYWPYYLGIVHEDTEKYEKAITHYMKSAKLDEGAASYTRISSCYQEMGDWASAIEYIDKAITLDPKDNDLILYKADFHYDAGDVASAVTMMDEYVERVPDEPFGYERRAWYKDNAQDVDGAIEDYTTAITLEVDDAHAYLRRGVLYLAKGEADLAKTDFETVVKLDTVPELGSSRMYALAHMGLKDEAVAWMDKILDADGDDQGTYYEAACLYSLMGECEKSLSYLEKSLEKGNKSYNHMMRDNDLVNIRDTEAFAALMEKYFPKKAMNEAAQVGLIEYTERVVEVPFTRQGGVTQVKCSVNDLPLHFIFDTGASDVSISRVEATFMFKNGYLSEDDVIGKTRYMDANGDISIGTVFNVRKITFGGLELENVRASVVESNHAPLLLGQSVLNRLGKIEIDYERSVLKITTRERKM
jgi:clan AA aspartic protease (TIGR02281 family)